MKRNLEKFLPDIITFGIDLCGDYGEHHSIVTGLNNLGVSLKIV